MEESSGPEHPCRHLWVVDLRQKQRSLSKPAYSVATRGTGWPAEIWGSHRTGLTEWEVSGSSDMAVLPLGVYPEL